MTANRHHISDSKTAASASIACCQQSISASQVSRAVALPDGVEAAPAAAAGTESGFGARNTAHTALASAASAALTAAARASGTARACGGLPGKGNGATACQALHETQTHIDTQAHRHPITHTHTASPGSKGNSNARQRGSDSVFVLMCSGGHPRPHSGGVTSCPRRWVCRAVERIGNGPEGCRQHRRRQLWRHTGLGRRVWCCAGASVWV